ncbi:hypothetical protein ACFQH6_11925 [Halobacteriaceae archaeon GCM10025711]
MSTLIVLQYILAFFPSGWCLASSGNWWVTTENFESAQNIGGLFAVTLLHTAVVLDDESTDRTSEFRG